MQASPSKWLARPSSGMPEGVLHASIFLANFSVLSNELSVEMAIHVNWALQQRGTLRPGGLSPRLDLKSLDLSEESTFE